MSNSRGGVLPNTTVWVKNLRCKGINTTVRWQLRIKNLWLTHHPPFAQTFISGSAWLCHTDFLIGCHRNRKYFRNSKLLRILYESQPTNIIFIWQNRSYSTKDWIRNLQAHLLFVQTHSQPCCDTQLLLTPCALLLNGRSLAGYCLISLQPISPSLTTIMSPSNFASANSAQENLHIKYCKAW